MPPHTAARPPEEASSRSGNAPGEAFPVTRRRLGEGGLTTAGASMAVAALGGGGRWNLLVTTCTHMHGKCLRIVTITINDIPEN